ncbi:hypothetical protein PT974_06444 [Cladobotryum mycophilum]|uniref:C2H2-type domain-containing protein n=1 Tax=Cladobotryum mycophilum TaxID=491253 RepID=A0ABR0SLL7_9HYPO
MEQGNSTSQLLLGGPELVFGFTEKHLEERINPTISPEDEEWTQMYDKFEKLLGPKSNQTLGQVLAAHFTEHEVRLFSHTDCSELKAIQDENTRRYQNLLNSRFRGVESDMITKLTMMYFGLPVEPTELDLRSAINSNDTREPEAPRFDVQPPLNFLTAHRERTWGNENLRGREEFVGPLPVAMPEGPILRLRGGDDYSDDESLYNLQDLEDLEDPEDADGYESSGDELEYHINEYADYVPKTESPIDLGGDDWVNLYGFQGVVPFLPGNWTTFSNAIRRLLSLHSDFEGKISIIHYDKEDGKIVDEVFESLPLTSQSPGMEYITNLFEKDWRYHWELSAFFVKLRSEPTPRHWQPQKDNLGLDVVQVRCTLPEAPSYNKDPPMSYSYVSFPRLNQPRPPAAQIQNWGANQYSLYIRTALEVLVGRSRPARYHHGFHRFCDSGTDPESVPYMYGLVNISSFDLVAMLASDAGGSLELRQDALAKDEIAFILPGYYPIGGDAHMTIAEKAGSKGGSTRDELFPTATRVIRNMVKKLLGKNADGLRHVRILAGAFVLGPDCKADQPYYSITMSDNIKRKCEEPLDSILSELVELKVPVVVLYPEWEDDETFIYGGWTGDTPDKAVQVPMPPLSSTVEDFRGSVAELLKRTGDTPRQLSTITKGKGYISIQPVLGPNGETSSPDQIADFPCLFVGPYTTDDEWFAIRAKIPTQGAVVNVLGEGDWDWMSQVFKNSIWGPRYGYVAEADMNRLKPTKKSIKLGNPPKIAKPPKPPKSVTPDDVDEMSSGVMKYSPNVPIGKDKRVKETNGPGINSSTTMIQTAPKQNLSRGFNPNDPPLDPDDRRRTWANQPSIFDGHNLRTWPANSGIRIPSTAPPKEHMLRVGNNVPMVSKSILTPTEQAELQKCFYDMRNIALSRVSKCSYADCHFTYKHGDADLLAEHMESMHLARKCLWCDEALYEHWTEAQRRAHIRKKHKDQLMEALGVTRGTLTDHGGNGTVSIPLKQVSRHPVSEGLVMVPGANSITTLGIPHPRPVPSQMQTYCDRCGRDRAAFFNDAERDYHDRNCRPGIYNNARCEFCKTCGSHYWLTMGDTKQSNMADDNQASCSHSRDNPAGHHCHQCGFDMHSLPPEGNQLHKTNCKGYESTSGRFCCYCGTGLWGGGTASDPQRNIEHMRQCFARLAAGARSENDLNGLGLRLYATQLGPPGSRPSRQFQDEELGGQAAQLQVVQSLPSPVSSKRPAPRKGKKVERGRLSKVPEVDLGVADSASQIQLPTEPKRPSTPGPSGTKTPKPPIEPVPMIIDEPPSPLLSIEPMDEDLPPASTNRRKTKRKKKRNSDRTSDGDYEAGEDEDDDDDTDMESEAEHPDHPRRARSPDWNKKLGPEDPDFEPKGDYYCSKIRNGIGSAENLPNHSGWIPASEMPKPLSTFRKKFLQKYPAYGRTLYPLNEANRNGSYWRSDPNNDENTKWWGIPWPPYELDPPYQSDEDVEEDLVGLVPDDADPDDKKRKRGRTTRRPPANPLPLADRITQLGAQPSAGPNAARQDAGNDGIVKKTKRMGKSTAKRQKTK